MGYYTLTQSKTHKRMEGSHRLADMVRISWVGEQETGGQMRGKLILSRVWMQFDFFHLHPPKQTVKIRTKDWNCPSGTLWAGSRSPYLWVTKGYCLLYRSASYLGIYIRDSVQKQKVQNLWAGRSRYGIRTKILLEWIIKKRSVILWWDILFVCAKPCLFPPSF